MSVGADSILKLELPNNLPLTFDPITIKADNIKTGLQETFKELTNLFKKFRPALLLFPFFTFGPYFNCGCYIEGTNFQIQYMSKTNEIFEQAKRPNPPIHYWYNNSVEDAKKWVWGEKNHDLVTCQFLADGFEHDIVIIINDHENFAINEINQIMRTTGVLVEVNVPDGKCFGDCEL